MKFISHNMKDFMLILPSWYIMLTWLEILLLPVIKVHISSICKEFHKWLRPILFDLESRFFALNINRNKHTLIF